MTLSASSPSGRPSAMPDDIVARATAALEGVTEAMRAIPSPIAAEQVEPGFWRSCASWDQIIEKLAPAVSEFVAVALEAAQARIAELETTGPWMEHIERQRAMKRERDGECICDTGPETGGPEETCPWHGREYQHWVAEVERLQRAGKTLGKIIDDSLRDVLEATGAHDLIGEDGDGDWMLVFERLMELRPARDAALAEVERLRAVTDIIDPDSVYREQRDEALAKVKQMRVRLGDAVQWRDWDAVRAVIGGAR